MTHRRLALGRRGEQAAAEWYEKHGYRVLARNWRCALGEIDLVCTTVGRLGQAVLVVCEVKTRTSDSHGHPLEALTPAKVARLRRLAAAFLGGQGNHFDEVRFDVAAVTGSVLDVIEGAF